MTKRRLAPKEQQFVEDYLAELNRLQAMPIFDRMSLTEVAKHITSVLKEQDREQTVEKEMVGDTGIVFPGHLVAAHAKYITGKWLSWRLTQGDQQLAAASLARRYRSRWKASS